MHHRLWWDHVHILSDVESVQVESGGARSPKIPSFSRPDHLCYDIEKTDV